MHQKADALSPHQHCTVRAAAPVDCYSCMQRETRKATSPYSEYGVCFILFTVHLL